MKTDLISRSELFNRLATVPIKAESVETTTEIFKIINSMPVESGGLSESDMEIFCDDYCRYPYICVYQEDLDRICDSCQFGKATSARIESGSDLISRTEAIKALTKCAGVGKRALSVIEELPGVTEKGAER